MYQCKIVFHGNFETKDKVSSISKEKGISRDDLLKDMIDCYEKHQSNQKKESVYNDFGVMKIDECVFNKKNMIEVLKRYLDFNAPESKWSYKTKGQVLRNITVHHEDIRSNCVYGLALNDILGAKIRRTTKGFQNPATFLPPFKTGIFQCT